MHHLAIVVSHPIQYHAPWYRALAGKLDLHVYYAHKANAADQAAAGFGVPFEWDIPLLEGYPFSWLGNQSRHPGLDHFFGCDTPGVKGIIQKENFDAVMVNGWNLLCYWQGVSAARNCGIPVLVRGDSQLQTPRGLALRIAKKIGYPLMLKKFDAFLSVGRRHSEYLKHYGVSHDKIFSVPHCVDNEFFKASADQARRASGGPRGCFGLPGNGVVFLFAGKFIPQKRPLDFLWALDSLQQWKINAHGLLIGDGPMRPMLEKHIQEHKTSCTLGGFLNQREIGRAYAASDALVLPSESETWGLVVNEAMACGVPAVVSDQAGCAPDLIVDGQTGFTHPCGKVNELAQQMGRIAQDHDLLARLSRGASEHISAFSIEAACQGLLAALDFAIRNKNL